MSKGLAQGPVYVAARAGFEPATLRSNGIDSTNAPPRPTNMCLRVHWDASRVFFSGAEAGAFVWILCALIRKTLAEELLMSFVVIGH